MKNNICYLKKLTFTWRNLVSAPPPVLMAPQPEIGFKGCAKIFVSEEGVLIPIRNPDPVARKWTKIIF
jgi:hypothetical protein